MRKKWYFLISSLIALISLNLKVRLSDTVLLLNVRNGAVMFNAHAIDFN
jgi:hypothetical protein